MACSVYFARLVRVLALACLVAAGVLPLSGALLRPSVSVAQAQGLPQALPARAVRAPAVQARSAFLLDVASGAVLFQKFPDTRRPMASTTKTMTGLLAVESGRLDEVATVSRAAANVGETTMGLVEGEQLPLRELLYGLMMNSGNDAGIAIAEHLAGSVRAFTAQMNARAAVLGLRNTRFANPHGLDHWIYDSPDHFASARDLATLGAAAFANPVLAQAMGTAQRLVPGPRGEPHRLRHSVSALWWYPGSLGGKTGWTEKAGQVRILGAERAGTRLVAVVMHSPDHVVETRDLLDYGFALSKRVEARTSVPLGAPLGADASAVPATPAMPDPRLAQAWAAYKRLVLTGEGRVRQGRDGASATADAQADALLHAVWQRDRTAFDAVWGWTQVALSRQQAPPGTVRRDFLFASRWTAGNVTDWSNSTAADQRLAAALLLASRLWDDPSYAAAATKILAAVIDRAAISWDVGGVPAVGWSVPAANSALKELDPATTSGATLTPAFYRMFAEAARETAWLWALEGTYTAVERATAANGTLGPGAGLLPGWFSVSRESGRVGQPVDPTWQTAGFTPESAALAWQLALDDRWHAGHAGQPGQSVQGGPTGSGEGRARGLLASSARFLARDLAQRGRMDATYTRGGTPGGAETEHYGALAGVALVEPEAEAALRARIEAQLTSNEPERVLDGIGGLWLLAGGPPNWWRIWNPPLDLPTTRNDGVVPPADGYPWRYFTETGHTVHGAALEHFNATGGLAVYGLPRTEEFVEDGKTVQYFQRGRLEFGPNRQRLSLAPLGERVAQQRGVLLRPEARRVAPFESDEQRLYIPQTGHSLVAGFKRFYEQHGGAAMLGHPLTEELVEEGFTMQYFERVVLEYVPGKAVQPSLLGDDLLREKGWLK